MYRNCRLSFAKPKSTTQFLSGGDAWPTAYHRQATMCPALIMQITSFMMSPKTTSTSDGKRSSMRLKTSPIRARRSSLTIRRMRKIRVALPTRANPKLSMLFRESSTQSVPTTVASKKNHVLRYLLLIHHGRISIVPSKAMKPDKKEVGMSRVQNTRVTQSMMSVTRFGGSSKKPIGIMTMSQSTSSILATSQMLRRGVIG
mmetsp:Transcript_71378/g.202485  ORF Transcript_71378/g.202485 Transcript_71378/m.202485 type:complete len:201 (+) Transcript_71378:1333-1935(+)